MSGINICPEVYEARDCGLRGKNFESRKIRVIQLCKETHKNVQLFRIELAKASVAESNTQELTKITAQFNDAVDKLNGTSMSCRANGKNGYKTAEETFAYLLNVTAAEALSKSARVHAENNPIPLSSEIFVGRGEIMGYETKLNDYTTGGKGTGQEQLRGLFVETVGGGFLQKVFQVIAVFMVVIAGFQLFFVRGQGAAEELTKKRQQVLFIVVGFAILSIATQVVDYVFFGHQGEIFQGEGIDASREFAAQGFREIAGIAEYLKTLLVISAVAAIVIQSLRMILGAGAESEQTNAKKQIQNTIIAVGIVISLAPFLNIFMSGGRLARPTAVNLIEFVSKWADYLLGFVGFFAVITLVYAGIRMIVDFGNGEAQEQMKKLATSAAIGVVLAFSAWTIINFFANPSGSGLQTYF
jgi:hypothetical protein